MLILARIAELQEAGSTCATREEFRELIDTARVLEWLDANRRSVAEARGETPTGCRIEVGGTTLIVQYGRRGDSYPHESLRAAVLAALGKGEKT